MSKLPTVILLMCIVLAIVFVPPGRAQSMLVGTAYDSTGAVRSNATITVTNVATQLTRSVVADAAGHYAFPTLPPGSYNLMGVSSGFEKAEITGIVLTVGQTAGYDVHFKVGAVTSQVTIQANPAKADTETSSLGQLISGQQLEDLPLNGRNYVSLSYLGSSGVPLYQGHSSPVLSNTQRPDLTAHISGGRGDANS